MKNEWDSDPSDEENKDVCNCTVIDEKKDICSCTVIHKDAISKARSGMPQEKHLYDLAEVFKVFGDLTRIRILCALIETELCVCDISALLEMTQSSISHQLRVLKQAKLVKYRKEGKIVYYSLEDEHVQHIFAQALIHVKE